MYMDMLERAVKAMRAGKEPNIEQPLADNTDVNLRIPALIPEDYLPDVHSRLVLYKRIAGAETHAALRELQVEMIDRFGLLPEPAKNLLRVTEIKLTAEAMGVSKLEASATGGKIEFGADAEVDPLKIVQLVQSQPSVFSLAGANGLNFKIPMEKAEDRLQRITDLLESLKPQ